MPYFGAHLSTTKGYAAMTQTAINMKATTFAYFVRPPRGGALRALDMADIQAMQELLDQHNFGPLVAHAPYIYNLASKDAEKRTRAIENMVQDLERLDIIGHSLYNFHPGAHVGQGKDTGIALIVDALNQIFEAPTKTTVLLETMVGKGSELGGTFEELAETISRVDKNERLGVCLDTCHVSDGGYDIAQSLDQLLGHFDEVIGLERLMALHLNDSKNPVGAKKDRHEKLGLGHLGLATFAAVATNERLSNLPMVLETPNELDGYAFEVELLNRLAAGEPLSQVQAALDARVPEAE